MSAQPISLALGCGGARGIPHIGVLRLLEQENILPSYIAGTSIGAVIGAMFACYRDTKIIEQRIAELVNSDFLRKAGLTSYTTFDNTIKKHGIEYMLGRLRQNIKLARMFTHAGTISSEWLLEAVEYLIDDVDIADFSIPFCAVATDLHTGNAVLFQSGPVRVALAASSAIPGVFSPVELDGMKLIDGGASYLTPVPPAKEFSTYPVIAVDVSKPIDQSYSPNRAYGIYFRSSDIAMMNYNTMLLEQADVVIRPDVITVGWADFHNYEELIEKGYIAANEKLPEIIRLVRKRNTFFRRWKEKPGRQNKTL